MMKGLTKAGKPRKHAPGAGRPPADRPTRVVSVRLNEEQVATAIEVGDGSLSRGVKMALDALTRRARGRAPEGG
jgi:hypothetical protein